MPIETLLGPRFGSPAESFEVALAAVPSIVIGGLRIAVIDRTDEAKMMLRAARQRPRGQRPLYLTSANGEVMARAHFEPALAELFLDADQITADGQSMVFASRLFCRMPLPERVATTDLFHDVARLAENDGSTFYLLGATEAENARAVAAVRAAYPRLNIVGNCHGYLRGSDLTAKLAEIDALAPDVLWLAMGVPHEQTFVRDHAHELSHVGVIKTSGGLFDFLSGKNRRAPNWMQRAGLEWLFRIFLEPRRLLVRYLVTNPAAIWLMLTQSR